MLASFGFFCHRGWIQPLVLTAGFHSSVSIRNFKKLQYKRFKAIKIWNKLSCSIQTINFLHDFISKIGLTFDSWEQNLWPILYHLGASLVATQLRQIRCIYYEIKSADNPYVLTNFCKLLSLTYYTPVGITRETGVQLSVREDYFLMFLMLFRIFTKKKLPDIFI